MSRVLQGSGTARLYRRSGAVVFCYHNVVPDELAGTVGDSTLHIGVGAFREQIDWITRRYAVVPIDELLTRLCRGLPVGGLAVLSFDDGYAGMIRHAVPILRAAGLPFLLFPVVRSATDGQPFWWDRFGHLQYEWWNRCVTTLRGDQDLLSLVATNGVHMPDDLLPASWAMLRSIQRDDCTVGAHTVTHRNLTTLPADEVTWELAHSRDRIAEELGVRADVIAYPYGRTNRTVQDEARRAGFRAGVGIGFGLVRRAGPDFDLARVNVPEGISMDTFACWASGLRLPVGSSAAWM